MNQREAIDDQAVAAEWLSAADLFLLPSSQESFGGVYVGHRVDLPHPVPLGGISLLISDKADPGVRTEEVDPAMAPFHNGDQFLDRAALHADAASWRRRRGRRQSLSPGERDDHVRRVNGHA